MLGRGPLLHDTLLSNALLPAWETKTSRSLGEVPMKALVTPRSSVQTKGPGMLTDMSATEWARAPSGPPTPFQLLGMAACACSQHWAMWGRVKVLLPEEGAIVLVQTSLPH